ncbi:hypothetical protein [Methyloprofundus sp.]|uniref:hypothetical protein n=1 Tax=Methyloprofundus sp. TaxID=2020875 RepID=UPI003D13A193
MKNRANYRQCPLQDWVNYMLEPIYSFLRNYIYQGLIWVELVLGNQNGQQSLLAVVGFHVLLKSQKVEA